MLTLSALHQKIHHFSHSSPPDSSQIMNLNPKPISILLIFLQIQFLLTNSYAYPTAMNCTDTRRVCTSFIAFQPDPSQNQTLSVLQSMFDVLQSDITLEKNDKNYVFIKKNCSCASQAKKYLTNTTYTVRSDDGVSAHDAVIDAYDGLAYMANSSRKTRVGAVVPLQLFCGCSSGLWNYLMSYVLKDGDSVESLASRFGVSMDSIESVNGFSDPDNVAVGELYYIPLNSVPGEPYPTETDLPPAPVPSPPDLVSENQGDGKAKIPYLWVLGSVGIGFGLIIITVLACILLRSSCCFAKSQGGNVQGPEGKNQHNFHILRRTRFICCKPGDWRATNGESSDRHINIIPKDNSFTFIAAIGADVFDMEKPVVFQYEEVLFSTDRFADSNLLGNGTYGSVYYGLLRDQEVAIKRMNAMKTKEFLAEMKVLCKVHHSNLVELIGYAATDDELFLIYEYSQKGSLRSHIHDPQNKGQTTLSWIMRVQIALDAARGLEYIHEHTKTHYVHRDIKSSNILLDGAFRGKISDFGLAKLIGKTNDGEEASVTRVVGTFGYLAPEYLSDGHATTKSDVYAFGVVLFEMISGREAITRTEGMATKNSERRSLASIMLAALKNSPDSMTMASMKDYIDPNLRKLYPYDCLFKMAMLAKHCVDEDPILRPDMKQIVISLSHILLSTVEWEATLSGNSQVFSGLVQGR